MGVQELAKGLFLLGYDNRWNLSPQQMVFLLQPLLQSLIGMDSKVVEAAPNSLIKLAIWVDSRRKIRLRLGGFADNSFFGTLSHVDGSFLGSQLSIQLS